MKMSSAVGVVEVASVVDRGSSSREETARSEMEFSVAFSERLKRDARSCGTGAIVSVHKNVKSVKSVNSSTVGRSLDTVDV
jgi:hypothetical protein